MGINWVNKILIKIARIGSVLPLIWFFGVLTFYFRTRFFLGHWPTYSNPDPKWLPFEFHHGILMLAVFPIFWSIFILPMIWIFQAVMQLRIISRPEAVGALESKIVRLARATREVQKEITFYFLGWVLIWATFFLPNRGFVDWFLD